MLENIDNFLFDRVYQPFADWFQEWTGVNNFLLARIVGIINLILVFFYEAIKESPRNGLNDILLGCVIFTAIGLPFLAEFEYKNSPKVFLNPFRRQMQWVRRSLASPIILFLVFFPILIDGKHWILAMAYVTHLSFMWILGCTPKPPTTSKFRKLWNRLAQSINFGLPEPDTARMPT